jgi:MarR family transcriptional regulator, 2-MHQ and catechol-resistance regulon repressor
MGIVGTVERASHLAGVYLESTVGSLGITQGEAHVLAKLAMDGESTVGALHEEFGHKRSTLTNIIDRLEQRGFVRRVINPDDRRSFLIRLTAAGRRAAAQVSAALGELEAEVLARIGPRDLHGLDRTVRALAEVVDSHRGGRA